MTDATQTSILISLIAGLLGILILVVGFGIKRWLDDQKERAEEAEERDTNLKQSIDGLKEAVSRLSEKFVLKSDYDRDMALLRITGGRRAADQCPQPDCPLISTDPRATHPSN